MLKADYGISTALARSIVLFPLIIAPLYSMLLFLPETRFEARWLLRYEHRPVEVITFVAMLIASFLGLALVRRCVQRKESIAVICFYAVFAAGMFVTAMEEVAWGQWIFGFDPPAAIKNLNKQGELTIHNLPGLGGNNEYFRMAFALGATVGLALSAFPRFRKIAVPRILWSWVLVITVLAAFDLYLEFDRITRYIYRTMGVYMAEVIEMLIGMMGLLYVWLKLRKEVGSGRQTLEGEDQ